MCGKPENTMYSFYLVLIVLAYSVSADSYDLDFSTYIGGILRIEGIV